MASAVRKRVRARTVDDPDDGRPAANAIYRAKVAVAARPRLAPIAARIRRPDHAVRRATDVVVEGFPRSANAFVSHAVQMGQRRALRVATGTHAPGEVMHAIRLGIPSLVLIRPAAAAVAREALIRPDISLELLLRGWIRFYRALIPFREGFVVGRFQDVTHDLGSVMRAMNERLGTDLVPFEHTEENVRAAFDAIEADWAARIDPSDPAFELFCGRPSPERDAVTAAIEQRLRAPRYAKLIDDAASLEASMGSDRPNDSPAGSARSPEP